MQYKHLRSSSNNNIINTTTPTFQSTIQSTVRNYMEIMDNLCCASVEHVEMADVERNSISSKDHLKMKKSFDLDYRPDAMEQDLQKEQQLQQREEEEDSCSSLIKMKPMDKERRAVPSSTKVLIQEPTAQKEQDFPFLLASILPSSFFAASDPAADEKVMEEEDYEYNGGNFCHCDGQAEALEQPHTLTQADTYTTVSLTQSYMFDDDEDDDEEEDYILSPATSVFRRTEEDDAAAEMGLSCSSQPPLMPSSLESSSGNNKDHPPMQQKNQHEAFDFLLRMNPQNYIIGSSNSSDDYDYSHHCGFFLSYNEDEAQ
eukprot:scaffold10922_cov147-Cylindrotheca_fusiformis.AAC.4